jgi:integrase
MKEIMFGIESNPVAAIPTDPDAKNKGKRFLSPEELRVFWNEPVKYGMNPRFHCALKLIISIGGVRVQEVVKAEKSEYDPEASLFLVPEERTKNRMGHMLPVSAIAEELIDEAHVLGVPKSPYLFPACVKWLELTQPFTFTSMNGPLTKFCKKVGMQHWTPRDLRRTARTMLEDEALGEEPLDIYFNHGRNNSVGRSVYSQSDMLKMKTRVTRCWEEILGKALWGKSA